MGCSEIKLKQMWDRAMENRANGPFPTSFLLRTSPISWTTPMKSQPSFSSQSTVKLCRFCHVATVAFRLFSVVLCFFLTFLAFPPSPLSSPSPAPFPVFVSIVMAGVSVAHLCNGCFSSAYHPLAILNRSLHYSGVRFIPSRMLTTQCHSL